MDCNFHFFFGKKSLPETNDDRPRAIIIYTFTPSVAIDQDTNTTTIIITLSARFLFFFMKIMNATKNRKVKKP